MEGQNHGRKWSFLERKKKKKEFNIFMYNIIGMHIIETSYHFDCLLFLHSTTLSFSYFMLTMYANWPEFWLNATIAMKICFLHIFIAIHNLYSTFQLNIGIHVFIYSGWLYSSFEPILVVEFNSFFMRFASFAAFCAPPYMV